MDTKEKVQLTDRDLDDQTNEMIETASLNNEINITPENIGEIDSKQPIFPPLTDEETSSELNATSSNDLLERDKSAFSSINTESQAIETESESNKYDTAAQPFPSAVDETTSETTNKIEQEVVYHYIEPKNPFASGLPEWTLEPPNILVVRKQKK